MTWKITYMLRYHYCGNVVLHAFGAVYLPVHGVLARV